MIRVIQNQNLLDLAVSKSGSVFSIFDFALINELSITEFLEPGRIISNIDKKQYENFDYYEVFKSYIGKQITKVNVIQNQSLLDVSIENDGSVLSVFEYALKNNISISKFLDPGHVLQLPVATNTEYKGLSDYFKSKNIQIATAPLQLVETESYSFPMEFPFSF